MVKQSQDNRQRAADETPTPTPVILDQEEQSFLDILNAHRQSLGLQPLTTSAALSDAAQWMSDDMVQTGVLPPDHIDSLGRTLDQRIAAFGYTNPLKLSENLASCQDTGQSAFDVWINSTTGHKEVMEDPAITEIGVGRSFSSSLGVWLWTTDFGDQASPTDTPTPTLTPTGTLTPTVTPTSTNTPTPTTAGAPAPQATNTPTPTPSPTVQATLTQAPTGTLTPTATTVPLVGATATPTPTAPQQQPQTPSQTPTTPPVATATFTPSPTQLPPINTYTPTPTIAQPGGVLQTVGIIGGIIIIVLGGIFLLIL